LKEKDPTKLELIMSGAYMDALICGVGIVKLTHVRDGHMEMETVPIEQFYDLSEELRWRAANMKKDAE
jgi:hypothetical protein